MKKFLSFWGYAALGALSIVALLSTITAVIFLTAPVILAPIVGGLCVLSGGHFWAPTIYTLLTCLGISNLAALVRLC